MLKKKKKKKKPSFSPHVDFSNNKDSQLFCDLKPKLVTLSSKLKKKNKIKTQREQETHTESRSSVSWNLFTKGSASVCIAGPPPKSPWIKQHKQKTIKTQITKNRNIYSNTHTHIYSIVLGTYDDDDGGNGCVWSFRNGSFFVWFVAMRSHSCFLSVCECLTGPIFPRVFIFPGTI